MFDALDPLRYVGSGAVRERAGRWPSWYRGPVGYEVRDLHVTAGDEAAFCHYLYRVSYQFGLSLKFRHVVAAGRVCGLPAAIRSP